MQSQPYRFQLLAPAQTTIASSIGAVTRDGDQHRSYLFSLQQLRGQVYLEDGAIQREQIDSSGRFAMHQDEDCWHFLLIGEKNEVVGCVRYLAHSPEVAFENLWVGRSPLVQDPFSGPGLRRAIEADLCWLRERNLGFAEVGGWTLHPGYRHTRAALELILGSFSWSNLVGVGIGCATATVRNNSSGILRRIGGTSYESEGLELPGYYDGRYGCFMEVLRFRFDTFDSRFQKVVEDVRLRLVNQSTIQDVPHCGDDASDRFRTTESLQALGRALKSAGARRSVSIADSALAAANRESRQPVS
jgi:hypothetical protein